MPEVRLTQEHTIALDSTLRAVRYILNVADPNMFIEYPYSKFVPAIRWQSATIVAKRTMKFTDFHGKELSLRGLVRDVAFHRNCRRPDILSVVAEYHPTRPPHEDAPWRFGHLIIRLAPRRTVIDSSTKSYEFTPGEVQLFSVEEKYQQAIKYMKSRAE